MSRSDLEETLYGQMRLLSMEEGSTFPLPVREMHFDWCCDHGRPAHKVDRDVRMALGGFKDVPWCNDCGLEDCEHEYRHGRNWRFDFAWPSLKLAAEVEGGTHSGGRHTRGSGFEKDAEKYNRAAELGWTVLRYTGNQVTSGEALVQIERMVNGAKIEQALRGAR